MKKKFKKMNIKIDQFQLKHSTSYELFLLSHAHTDHCIIPKKFPFVIYSTRETAHLVKHPQLRGILPYFDWVSWRHLFVYTFPSNHCYGAAGFYIVDLQKQEGFFYWGDGRPTSNILKRIAFDIKTWEGSHKISRTFQLDNRISDLFGITTLHHQRYPNMEECKVILTLLIDQLLSSQNLDIWIKLSHFGAIDALPFETYALKYTNCGERLADATCRHVFAVRVRPTQHKKMITVSRHYPEDCGLVREKFIVITLSSSWWFIQKNYVNIWEPQWIDPFFVRIFVCRHASPRENALVNKFL
jgi:hypothetical protein